MRNLAKLIVGIGLISSAYACKYLQDDKVSAEEKACSAQEGHRWQNNSCEPPPAGYIGVTACAAIRGATWDESQCKLPTGQADCTKVATNSSVWDGRACVAEDAPLNFFRLCSVADGSPELQHTLSVMSRAHQPASCQEIFDRLWALREMSFQGDGLTDLSPFAGFSELRSLNLWNNKISDLAPLSTLRQLTSLNLGHNNLTSLAALRDLSELNTLIISENQVDDVTVLASLLKLEYLDVSYNHINDLSTLKQRTFKRGYFDEGNKVP